MAVAVVMEPANLWACKSHRGREGKHATSPRANKFRSENLVDASTCKVSS